MLRSDGLRERRGKAATGGYTEMRLMNPILLLPVLERY